MALRKGNFALNSNLLISIVFSFFPISFILGNLITNLNFLLFCCLGIFNLRSKILTNKLNFPLKIISLFFVLVLFSTSLNFAESLYFAENEKFDFFRLIKSILFLRFFIVLLIVYQLSKFDIINYKFFFISAAIFPVLISIDVIFQYIFGYNVIGMKGLVRNNSSFFGDELISGGYIQNFSFFPILFLTNSIRHKNNLSNSALLIFTICILATGILLSGNRMPFILFLLGLFLLFFFGKSLRKILLISFCIIYIIYGSLTSTNVQFQQSLGHFYNYSQQALVAISKHVIHDLFLATQEEKELKKGIDVSFHNENNKRVEQIVKELDGKRLVHVKFRNIEEKWETTLYEDPETNSQKKLVLTALEVWKKKKVFGGGIKSFRVECRKILIEQKRGLCSNHPHNYYLEILTDLGIVGIISVMGIAFAFMIFLLKNYNALKKGNNLGNLFLLATIMGLFLELFPIKSSGSVFTTNNATYIILMSSIILSYSKLLVGENLR